MRQARRFLWLLTLLPLAAAGGDLGAIHARAMLDLSRPLLLHVENGDRTTLLLKEAYVQAGFLNQPEKLACSEKVTLMANVPGMAMREVELLSLDRFAQCLNRGGYRMPAGAIAVGVGATPVCEGCVAGEEVVTIPFSIRFSLKRPGVIEEYRAFTNYLFFQRPKGAQPIRFSNG